MTAPTPPILCNREAEEALCGSALIDPAVYRTIDIQPEDFYIARNRWIWEALGKLAERGVPADYLTVCEELERAGRIHEIGGPAYLMGLINQTPSALHAEAYARLVVDMSVRRRMVAQASDLAKAAYDLSAPTEQSINAVASAIPSLVRARGGPEHVAAYASRHYDRVQAAAEGQASQTMIPTGFADFDSISYGGLRRGEMLLLAGKPGKGKTKFAMQMAAQMAGRGYPGVAFQFETSEEEIMDREFSRQTGIPSERFESGELQDGEWSTYTGAVEKLSSPEFPLYLDFTPGLTTTGIRAHLVKLQAERGVSWFVIDYLKYVLDGAGMKEVERLNLISRNLKMICRELGLVGVVIHHLNKEGMRAEIPEMDAMSQGADLAFDADKILFLTDHIPEPGAVKDETMVTCVIAKSRRKIKRNFFHLIACTTTPAFYAPARKSEVAAAPNGNRPSTARRVPAPVEDIPF